MTDPKIDLQIVRLLRHFERNLEPNPARVKLISDELEGLTLEEIERAVTFLIRNESALGNVVYQIRQAAGYGRRQSTTDPLHSFTPEQHAAWLKAHYAGKTAYLPDGTAITYDADGRAMTIRSPQR